MSVKAILQGQNDKTPKLYLDITKLPEKPSTPIAAGEEIPYSWAEINAIALSGDAESYFSLGSLKECNLSTAVLGSTNPKMMVIGINQDADGTVTFQTQNCLNGNAFFGSSAQWIGSTARQLCQNFYNACETKEFIKVVSKGTCASTSDSRNADVTYNNETVFLLSERESGLDSYSPLSTSNSTTLRAECTQGKNFSYSYYSNNNSRIKNLGDSGGSSHYWERSRYYDSDSTERVCFVSSDGIATYDSYDNEYGYYVSLAPAFVIGNSALIQDKQDVTDKVKEALNAADKDVLTDVSSTLNAHQVDYSMHITSEEKSKIANVVNPNLLRNWYFANPINSRGKTNYNGSNGMTYAIDGWKIQYDTTLAFNSEGIALSGSWDIRQLLGNTIDGTYTLSILYKDASLTEGKYIKVELFNTSNTIIKTKTSGAASGLLTLTMKATDLAGFILGFTGGTNSVTFIAAKLELGDTQTLAHQDKDGNWILNEIPNREEEYIKCITSTVDTSDDYANKVITTTGQLCNPNLLDNWYFARPVNQRGKTEYTISWNQYCIDRWSVEADSFYIRLDSDELYLKNNDTASDRRQFKQILLNNTIPTGVEVTASILCSSVIGDCGLDVGLSDYPYSNVCPYVYLKEGLTYTTGKLPTNADFKIIVSIPSGGEVKIKAIKLELGDTQTLAHKENGVWVLNEIPDYGEQLRRCQRYYFKPQEQYGTYSMVSTGSNSLCGNVLYPVEMRTVPTVTLSSIRRHDNGTVIVPSSFSVGNNGGRNGFSVLYNIGNMNVDIGAWCGIDFTASADL